MARRFLTVGALFLVAVILRTPNLISRSIWFDEASAWQTASFPLGEMFESIRQNVHMPLYYVVLKGWMFLFGDSPQSLRGLSVLSGAATVVGMYAFGREVYLSSALVERPRPGSRDGSSANGADRFALAIAALVALSPYQVFASIETKMYSLGTALTALSSCALLYMLREGTSSRRWAVYATLCVALAYTHHYGLLTIGGQFLFLIGWALWRGEGERRKLLWEIAAVLAIVGVVFLPGAALLLEQAARVKEDYWIQPMHVWTIPKTVGEMMIPDYDFSRWELVVLCAALAFACGIVALRARRAEALLLVSALFPMAASALISLEMPIWFERYFRFVQLFGLTIAVTAVWRVTSNSSVGRLLLVCVVLFNVVAAYAKFWEVQNVAGRPSMRGIIERIRETAQTEQLVIVDHHFFVYFPAKYYARTNMEARILERSQPTPWGVWKDHGNYIVRPDDLVSREDVRRRLDQGIWLIRGPEMSEDARIAFAGAEASEDFEAVYYQDGGEWPLHITRYVKRTCADGAEE